MKRYSIMGYTYECRDIYARKPVFYDETNTAHAGWVALRNDIYAADACVGDRRRISFKTLRAAVRFLRWA